MCENLVFDSVDGLNVSNNKCHSFSPFAHLPLQAGNSANGAGSGLPGTVQIICAPSLEREKRTQGFIKTGQTEEFTLILHAGVWNQFSTITHTCTSPWTVPAEEIQFVKPLSESLTSPKLFFFFERTNYNSHIVSSTQTGFALLGSVGYFTSSISSQTQ